MYFDLVMLVINTIRALNSIMIRIMLMIIVGTKMMKRLSLMLRKQQINLMKILKVLEMMMMTILMMILRDEV